MITSGVGLQSLILNHLFEPNAVIGNIAGGLLNLLVNKVERSGPSTSPRTPGNCRQSTATNCAILNAFTQVINRMTMVENYSKSIEIKKQQLKTLEAAVEVANDLFQLAPDPKTH